MSLSKVLVGINVRKSNDMFQLAPEHVVRRVTSEFVMLATLKVPSGGGALRGREKRGGKMGRREGKSQQGEQCGGGHKNVEVASGCRVGRVAKPASLIVLWSATCLPTCQRTISSLPPSLRNKVKLV